jgi:hypothetical protein
MDLKLSAVAVHPPGVVVPDGVVQDTSSEEKGK